jgi:signal peptidase I
MIEKKMHTSQILITVTKISITIFIIIIISSILMLRIYEVTESSMVPYLNPGDLVLAVNAAFPFKICRNRICIYQNPLNSKMNVIKRCIAIRNDSIYIKDGFLVIKGGGLKCEYIQIKKSNDFQSVRISITGNEDKNSIIVPDKQYYFIGDNYDFSIDSRVYGPVEKKRIIGLFLLKL